MGLDTNIALGVKTPEIVNPLALYSKALGLQNATNQNAMAQYTLGKARREDADQNMLRQRLQGVDINTPEGQAKARNALLSIGNVKGAADLDKSILDRQNTQSQISERDFKRAKEGMDIFSGAIAPLVMNPAVSHNDVFTVGGRLEQMGLLNPTWKQSVPMNQAELPAYIRNIAMTLENGRKALELQAPKSEIKDVGNALQGFTTDKLTGQVTPGGILAQKTPEGWTRSADGKLSIEPGFLQGKKDIAAAGAPRVSMSVNTKGDTKYAEQRLGDRAKAMDEQEKKATAAYRANEALDRFVKASAGSTQGSLQPLMTGVQNMFASFGYEAKNLSDTRVMEQAIGDILQNKMAELGARGLTDRDMETLKNALPRIAVDRKAREDVARIVKTSNEAVIDEYAEARKSEMETYPEIAGKVPEPKWFKDYAQRKASDVSAPPSGISADLWKAMTPQEKKLWKK